MSARMEQCSFVPNLYKYISTQCSKHQSRSLVTTLQKWQNKDGLRTTKNMDMVKDASGLVSWLQ